jgi:uncharacterized protein
VSAAAPVPLPFERVAERLRAVLDAASLTEVQAVVAIARGGVVAGALCAYHLGVPLRLLRLRYRDDANSPMSDAPELIGVPPALGAGPLLLVDDVSVSGASLRAAQALLGAPTITLVVKGRAGAADLVVFDDVPSCVVWPWHEDVPGDGEAAS